MPRIAKERRIRRQARLVRKREQAVKFWGESPQEAEDRFLLTLSTDRHMERALRRKIREARARARIRADAGPLDIRQMDIATGTEWTVDAEGRECS